MTIQVTKEPINLREKLNELETNKGLKGNEILQAETAQEVRSLIGAGRKNLIINGGFDVWQRGTSATSYNSYASADRWKHLTYGAISKVSDGDRNTVLKMVTSTTSSVNYIRQYLEAPANLKGKTLTLSFWMKTSEALTTRVDFWLHDSSSNYAIYGKDGGVAGDAIALSVATTTSWAKYSVSVTVPTYTEKTDGTDKLEINVGVANSTAAGKSVYIDDVQLELGSVATDFEHRSYGEELALCQRYYQSYDANNAVGVIRNGTPYADRMHFSTTMRVAPTLALYTSNGGYTAYYAGNKTWTHESWTLNPDGFSHRYATSGLTSWDAFQTYGKYYFDAEL